MAKEKPKVIPLGHIRGLLVAQQGRCAISGEPLNPLTTAADHIDPLSRQELEPSHDTNNIWLVDKKINAIKGTLTYDELIEWAERILAHQKSSRTLLQLVRRQGIKPMSKAEFDKWVDQYCDTDGNVSTDQE